MIVPDLMVSVCHPRHLRVWRTAAPRLLRSIEPRQALLLVPDAAVPDFTKITPPEFNIVAESHYAAPFAETLKHQMKSSRAGSREGWYLQQLLKLSVLFSLDTNQNVVLWDSDTVPLRKIRFFSRTGSVFFYGGTEFHAPYFDKVFSLTGMKKIVGPSFIAQCMPVRTDWSHAFFSYLQQDGEPWYQKIISILTPRERSGFSEYETLGTFFSHQNAGLVCWQQGTWFREGFSAFGSPEAVPWFEEDDVGPDFVAFEEWERAPAGPLRRLLRQVSRGAKTGWR